MSDVFEHRIEPHYYDFDPSSMVHNATYVRWLEDVRVAFQQASVWPPDRMYAADLAAVLTRTEIVYTAPIRLSDSVVVRVWVTRLGRSTWSLSLRFVHPETSREYARAEQSGCYIRRSTGKPVPMPREFADFCRQYLVEECGPE